MSALRPQVAEFAALMEREMLANAHKDSHPLSHDFNHLLNQLREHVEKFAAEPTDEHAADVANLAMLALAEIAPAESGDGLDRLPGAASSAAGREQHSSGAAA